MKEFRVSVRTSYGLRAGVFAACLGATGLIAVSPAHAKATITSFDAGLTTNSFSINDEGWVAGYTLIPGERQVMPVTFGFVRQSDGTITTFSPPTAANTYAYGIDEKGSIAGFYADGNDGLYHGFVRRPDGKILTFDPQGSLGTFPYSISKGAAAGSYYLDNGNVAHGFLRARDGSITTFDPEGSAGTYTYSISNGYVAGYWFDGALNRCFLRTPDGTISSFSPDGSIDTECYAVNAGGTVAGYYTDASLSTHGFKRTPDGTITIFDIAGDSGGTYPNGINRRGDVTGNWHNQNGIHGFLVKANGKTRSFDADGSTATFGISINGSDVITGFYNDSNGIPHGFIRTP